MKAAVHTMVAFILCVRGNDAVYLQCEIFNLFNMKSGIKLLSLASVALATMAVAIFTFMQCRDDATEPTVEDNASLQEHAELAYEYARVHDMNTRYAFFTDYGIISGKPRFYIWDYEKGRVIYKTHAMHGPGMGSTAEKPVFSNKIGSNCSSLGKFEVTREPGATMTRAMRLKGLDRCNSNAYCRGLMIHGAYWVNNNKWRASIPLNDVACQGCVTLTTDGSARVRNIVMSEDKPILLWNFCSNGLG